MRQLLNTLFVTSEDIYLSLDGENVVANREKEVLARHPPAHPVRHHLLRLSRHTACWPTIAPRRWRAWGWTPTWAFSTGIAPAGAPWLWI